MPTGFIIPQPINKYTCAGGRLIYLPMQNGKEVVEIDISNLNYPTMKLIKDAKT